MLNLSLVLISLGLLLGHIHAGLNLRGLKLHLLEHLKHLVLNHVLVAWTTHLVLHLIISHLHLVVSFLILFQNVWRQRWNVKRWILIWNVSLAFQLIWLFMRRRFSFWRCFWSLLLLSQLLLSLCDLLLDQVAWRGFTQIFNLRAIVNIDLNFFGWSLIDLWLINLTLLFEVPNSSFSNNFWLRWLSFLNYFSFRWRSGSAHFKCWSLAGDSLQRFFRFLLRFRRFRFTSNQDLVGFLWAYLSDQFRPITNLFLKFSILIFNPLSSIFDFSWCESLIKKVTYILDLFKGIFSKWECHLLFSFLDTLFHFISLLFGKLLFDMSFFLLNIF